MATPMVNDNSDEIKMIKTKFMNPGFLDYIIETVSEMFDKMGIIDKYLFSEYVDFIKDVRQFKQSLLKFILESKISLNVLKDNFQKPKYKQASDEQKLKFIKQHLDEIEKETLFEYLLASERLIQKSIQLHEKYGTMLFKVKYVALNLLGFTIGGAIAGFTIGLILPFLEPIEIAVGALTGAIVGLICVAYELIFNWKNHMKKIEDIKNNLKKVQSALQRVLAQMKPTHEKVGMAKRELENQCSNNSFQEITDLEQYILTSLVEFDALEKVLLRLDTNL